MEGGKWREERFVLAPWAVRSVWIRFAGRNLAGEIRVLVWFGF
jgi:hypothetical protein